MFETFLVEAGADGADTPVHHVGWGNHIRSSARLIERLFDQGAHGGVIGNFIALHEPVMAMACIGVECNIGDHADLRNLLLDRAHGAADQIVGIESLRAALIAQFVFRIGKERNSWNAKCSGLCAGRHRLVNRQALDARHGGDFLPYILAIDDEDRPDQIVGREHILAHQAARPFRAAVAARPVRQHHPVGRIGIGWCGHRLGSGSFLPRSRLARKSGRA